MYAYSIMTTAKNKFAITAKMYLTACQTTFPPERKTKLRARTKSAAPAMHLAVGSATAVEKPIEDNTVNKKLRQALQANLQRCDEATLHISPQSLI